MEKYLRSKRTCIQPYHEEMNIFHYFLLISIQNPVNYNDIHYHIGNLRLSAILIKDA